MNIAALTNVYNEPFFLPIWLSHYEKMVDDIYVIDSETDDGSVKKALKKHSFTILHNKECVGGRMSLLGIIHQHTLELQEIIKNLLRKYDWVVYAHADEFVIPDPTNYSSLKDFISKLPNDKNYVYCNGFDVLQDDEPDLINTKLLLSQRKYWVTTNSYSKPLLTRVPIEYADGFHYVIGEAEDFMNNRSMDFYLAHFARADRKMLKDRNPYRKKGATLEENESSIDQFMKVDWDLKEEIPDYLKKIV